MTKQATKQATKQVRTVTAKQGKPSTAEKQAKPVLTVRDSVTKLCKSLRGVETRMSTLVLQAVALRLDNDLNEKEQSELYSAIPKQRKADYKAIVEGPANYRAESEYPKGLQARARYMKLRADGYTPTDARDIANHKKSRKDVDAANGKAPAAGKPGNQEGDTEERKVPDSDDVGGLHDLELALGKLRKECADYNPEAKRALNAVIKAAESLSKAMANG